MYSSYSFTISALNGVSGQRHALAALYSWENTIFRPNLNAMNDLVDEKCGWINALDKDKPR
jgi:hypothetical protein